MVLLRYFRHKVAIALTLFSASLSALFCMLIFASMQTTDDYVRKALLYSHYDGLQQNYSQSGQLPERRVVSNVQILVEGIDPIPDALVNLQPGYFEEEEVETHTLITDLTHDIQHQRIYLIHTAEGTDTLEQYEPVIKIVLATVAVIVTVIGSILGIFLAGKIAKPAQELVTKIRGIDPDQPEFEPLGRNDEFGEISAAFSSTIDQINQVVEREKQFSAYASHELRTPVAVIKSSLSLWDACSKQPVERTGEIKERIVARIDMANQQMEDVIQTFLLLGKQSVAWKEVAVFRLDDLLRELLLKYQRLNQGKDISLKMVFIEPVELEKNRSAVSLVLSNALRNAFDYSASEIQVSLHKGRLVIANDIDQLRVEQAEHFGFGLKIVNDLCDLLGWRCHCDHSSPESFVIEIQLSDDTYV